MRKFTVAGFALSIAAGLAACNQGAAPPAAMTPAVDVKAAATQVHDLHEQWVAAIASKNLDATVALYAADAQFLPPNSGPVTGAEIRKGWEGMLALPGLSLTFEATTIGLDSNATMAYAIGHYKLGFDSAHGRVEEQGKLLEVWRNINGSWKVEADMYNSSEPLAAETAPQGKAK